MVEMLDVGDVRLDGPDGEVLLFERKTWVDLSASMVDGRFKEQRARFEDSVGEKERLVYVIEHAVVHGDDDTSARGVSPKSLNCALVKLALRDHYTVLRTANRGHTAETIVYVGNQLRSGGLDPKPLGPPLDHAPTGGKRKRGAALDDPDRLLSHMLTGVPGLSGKRARAVVAKFGSLSAIASAKMDDIASVVVDGRRVGPAAAKRLKGVC